MARPAKKGLEYFPMDTDFFADKKIRLLRGEFGAAGDQRGRRYAGVMKQAGDGT